MNILVFEVDTNSHILWKLTLTIKNLFVTIKREMNWTFTLFLFRKNSFPTSSQCSQPWTVIIMSFFVLLMICSVLGSKNTVSSCDRQNDMCSTREVRRCVIAASGGQLKIQRRLLYTFSYENVNIHQCYICRMVKMVYQLIRLHIILLPPYL